MLTREWWATVGRVKVELNQADGHTGPWWLGLVRWFCIGTQPACSGVIYGGAGTPLWGAWVLTDMAECKTNALPAMLSLSGPWA